MTYYEQTADVGWVAYVRSSGGRVFLSLNLGRGSGIDLFQSMIQLSKWDKVGSIIIELEAVDVGAESSSSHPRMVITNGKVTRNYSMPPYIRELDGPPPVRLWEGFGKSGPSFFTTTRVGRND